MAHVYQATRASRANVRQVSLVKYAKSKPMLVSVSHVVMALAKAW
jgi:hypothetical protein